MALGLRKPVFRPFSTEISHYQIPWQDLLAGWGTNTPPMGTCQLAGTSPGKATCSSTCSIQAFDWLFSSHFCPNQGQICGTLARRNNRFPLSKLYCSNCKCTTHTRSCRCHVQMHCLDAVMDDHGHSNAQLPSALHLADCRRCDR